MGRKLGKNAPNRVGAIESVQKEDESSTISA